jgi:hypothetical protein
VSGIAVPPGGYSQNGGPPGSHVPEGDPHDIVEKPVDQLLEDAGIPWDDIVNGDALSADYRYNGDGSGNGWPDFGQLPQSEWPVVYASDPAGVSVNSGQSGRGVLVVRGNLTMNGNFQWDGVLMVGGSITSNGNQTLEGAIFTGLNESLGEHVNELSIGNGTKTFQYHSCNFTQAQQSLARLVPLPGSWHERM